MDHAIRNKGKIYLKLNQQLLIYVRDKGRVRKRRVVKTIEIDFVLLGRRNKLVISTSISFAKNRIGGSTVYIAIRVNTQMGKIYKVKVNT